MRRSLLSLVRKVLKDGTVLDGRFQGEKLVEGVAILADGRCFKGSFDAHGSFPLPGCQLEEDGDVYSGSFNSSWQRHGPGEAWLADGTHYKGTFCDDELVNGTVRIPNGVTEAVFEGTLRDECFVSGTLRQHDYSYTGTFSNNKPEGKGKLTFANGATQEGTFRDGLLHGTNCTMKLEGGFVYVGDFMCGKVIRGTMYTPTYTYEGEFDEQGKAHGEGTQTHLTVSPKLIFNGIWHHGTMMRGTCVDEYGAPVDWQERHDLQKATLEGEGYSSDSQLSFAKYAEAKLREADEMHRDMERSYVLDADKVAKETGHRPSKFELGYEHSVRQANEQVNHAIRSQTLQSSEGSASHSSSVTKTIAFDDALRDADDVLGSGSVNINLAKMKVVEQEGTQRLVSEKMEEQLNRFMKSQSSDASSSQDGEKRGLRIEGNPTWKGFTPSA